MRLLNLEDLADLIMMIDRWVVGQGDAIRGAVLGTTSGVWHLAIERSAAGGELRTFAAGFGRLDSSIRDRFEGIAFRAEGYPPGTDLGLIVDLGHSVKFPGSSPFPDVRRN